MEQRDVLQGNEHQTHNEPDKGPTARGIIVLGKEDPTNLDESSFREQATLFHASKKPDFHVDESFDYRKAAEAEGMTLGYGLYATSSSERALYYTGVRGKRTDARVFVIIPHKARMLDLRSVDDESINAPVPGEVVENWIAFAGPKIEAKLEELRESVSGGTFYRLLNRAMIRFDNLGDVSDPDFRRDILYTLGDNPYDATPGSPVAGIWSDFCEAENIDGVIYNEGGEGSFKDQADSTYVFYDLDTVGTYDDWQRRMPTN